MRQFLLSLALLGAVGTAANAAIAPAEIIPAQGGAIRITPMFHGSLQIEYKGKVIHVDPFSAGDYSGAKKADFVIVTHTHGDHLDVNVIKKLIKKGSVTIIAPLSAKEQLAKAGLNADPDPYRNHNGFSPNYPVTLMPDNGRFTFDENVNKRFRVDVQAVPMYNVVRERAPGQKYHPKGEFNGYILTLGGKRIYIAGDTEATPEMKRLKNIDVAFLPMNLPYTMTPQEAAVGARAFKPKVVYPYHYRSPFTKPNDNPQQFAKAMAGSGVVVKIRDWYGHPAK